MREVSYRGIRAAMFMFVVAMAGACGGKSTLGSLYDEAKITQDWSEVEDREAEDAIRRDRAMCFRAGGKIYCEDRECRCVKRSEIDRMMRSTIPESGPGR